MYMYISIYIYVYICICIICIILYIMSYTRLCLSVEIGLQMEPLWSSIRSSHGAPCGAPIEFLMELHMKYRSTEGWMSGKAWSSRADLPAR